MKITTTPNSIILERFEDEVLVRRPIQVCQGNRCLNLSLTMSGSIEGEIEIDFAHTSSVIEALIDGGDPFDDRYANMPEGEFREFCEMLPLLETREELFALWLAVDDAADEMRKAAL